MNNKLINNNTLLCNHCYEEMNKELESRITEAKEELDLYSQKIREIDEENEKKVVIIEDDRSKKKNKNNYIFEETKESEKESESIHGNLIIQEIRFILIYSIHYIYIYILYIYINLNGQKLSIINNKFIQLTVKYD